MAAAMGYGDVASLLMEHGSRITEMDNAGKTPPDYAFYYGQEQIGFSMLAAGASDSSLVSYLKDECLLSKNIGMGEAEVIYLGHSGWAIKTQNHLLVFDYFDNPRSRKPDHECLKAGCILPHELNGQNVTVFSTHGHQDHFNKSYFDWDDNNSGVSYVFCHQPVGITDEYVYIPANGDAEVNGVKIYVNKSTDGGGGFFVETDGLVIFHMGDHANGDDALSVDFKREIDLIAQKGKDIDLLFGPIRGCSLGTPAQVKTGIYYTLETLHPNLFIPMHSGVYTYANKAFTEQAQKDGITKTMKFTVARGDRFDYRKGEDVVLQNIDDQ